MYRKATSRALSQQSGSFARQSVSVRTVRRRMDSQSGKHGCGYPCCSFTDRSVFNVIMNDKPGAGMERLRILHRHIGPLPGMMVWNDIGYTSRSPLVRIDDTLHSARCISDALRPVALPFIRASPVKPYV
ncbi:hypothetical protein TNCV_2699501 [Trichonephila clavipes]|nr:hypothetical protein TNCV_2699501 [Trichonephila clavipes]